MNIIALLVALTFSSVASVGPDIDSIEPPVVLEDWMFVPIYDSKERGPALEPWMFELLYEEEKQELEPWMFE